MKIIFVFLALIVLAAVFIAAKLKHAQGNKQTGAYRSRKLMTANEEEFFGRLVVALPDHYIFPQVALSALLESISSDKKTAHGDRLRIAQQRVDYVVCTRRCEVVAVVELDDRTHSKAKDELRDSRVEQAGIRTVRFQSKNKPKVEAIRAMILGQVMAEPTTGPVGSGVQKTEAAVISV
jgi:hypothetical protein